MFLVALITDKNKQVYLKSVILNAFVSLFPIAFIFYKSVLMLSFLFQVSNRTVRSRTQVLNHQLLEFKQRTYLDVILSENLIQS